MNAQEIITKCTALKNFWNPRAESLKAQYKLIQMIDELAQEDMESFVGNDPRAAYNLALGLIDSSVPHRILTDELTVEEQAVVQPINKFFELAWRSIAKSYRGRGRPSFQRDLIGLTLATGWYCLFSYIDDNMTFAEIWNPAEVFPAWDDKLIELAHIFPASPASVARMALRNSWKVDVKNLRGDAMVYDYWYIDSSDHPINAVVVNQDLVKPETPLSNASQIPVFTMPVGGLPDNGSISGDKSAWKKEVGQGFLTTNENVYRYWNKWWSFSMQLLRDTAQTRWLELSKGSTRIVKPEDIFKRGAIFKGQPGDNVVPLGVPQIPMEIRATQLDMEAMMQRGGPPWAMFGGVTQQVSAYVMAQIAAATTHSIKSYHQGIIDLYSDVDNFWLEQMRDRGYYPYRDRWAKPQIPMSAEATASYEIKIPGDLTWRATVARMLSPEFSLSSERIMSELFPEIKNPVQEKANVRADKAENHEANASISLISFAKQQSRLLRSEDPEGSRLYQRLAELVEKQMEGQFNPNASNNIQVGQQGLVPGMNGETANRLLQPPTL